MSLHADTQQLAALTVLESLIKARKARLRSDTLTQLQEQGIERLRVSLDGESLGTVTVNRGRETVKVFDEAALLQWARENAPDEVVTQVRDSFRRSLLHYIRRTGEIPTGTEIVTADPYPQMRLEEKASERVLTALRTTGLGALLPPTDEKDNNHE